MPAGFSFYGVAYSSPAVGRREPSRRESSETEGQAREGSGRANGTKRIRRAGKPADRRSGLRGQQVSEWDFRESISRTSPEQKPRWVYLNGVFAFLRSSGF